MVACAPLMIDAVGAGGSLPTREEPALVSIACHGHGYGRLFAMTTTKQTHVLLLLFVL